jgi:hypothetical protein
VRSKTGKRILEMIRRKDSNDIVLANPVMVKPSSHTINTTLELTEEDLLSCDPIGQGDLSRDLAQLAREEEVVQINLGDVNVGHGTLEDDHDYLLRLLLIRRGRKGHEGRKGQKKKKKRARHVTTTPPSCDIALGRSFLFTKHQQMVPTATW